MKCFILAGGFATRLWPLTEKRAKPLLPLAGKPIIDHMLTKIPADVPVTVSTNAAFAEGFRQWQQHTPREVTLIIEQTGSDDHKLGALGAVAQWIEQEKIDDDLLLLTGDNYCGFALRDFLAAYEPGTPLLAAYDIGSTDRAKSFGTVITDEEQGTSNEQRATCNVLAFEEKPTSPQTTLVSTGCSVLPKDTLPILRAYAQKHPDNVGGIFEELLRRKHAVHCYSFTEPWFDIGSFEAYLEATKVLVGENVMLSDGASVERCECSGSVVVGKNTRVSDSKLWNVVLFDDCVIEDCELTDCIIDQNCTLQHTDLKGKMLREGTVLHR